jgi:hypothetical protein
MGKGIFMSDKTIEWLLQGDPWIEYRTRLDLLGQAEKDPQVVAARKAMLADVKIQSLLTELTDWPGVIDLPASHSINWHSSQIWVLTSATRR